MGGVYWSRVFVVVAVLVVVLVGLCCVCLLVIDR